MSLLARRVPRTKVVEDDDTPRVRVIVRVRPLKPTEEGRCVELSTNSTVVLHELTENSFGRVTQNRHEFRLDGVYDENCTQDQIFNAEVKPALDRALDGYNTTIFTYGITGSGKTFTMVGNQEHRGIIPRSVEYLFRKSQPNAADLVYKMQFYEIIKDKIYDLITWTGKDLPLREAGDKEVVVCNLEERRIIHLDDFHSVFQNGCKNRTTKATLLNDTSSRSHAVVVIRVYAVNKKSKIESLVSKIHLIDLAGSEDNRQTGNRGDRLNESNAINLSLFALGNCISALNAKKKRIPFRESKLTRVLSDSLGGTSSSTLICTIPPCTSDFASTFTTLTFAVKSRNIHQINTSTTSSANKLSPSQESIIEETQAVVPIDSQQDGKKSTRKRSNSIQLDMADKENTNGMNGTNATKKAKLDEVPAVQPDCPQEPEVIFPTSNAEAYIRNMKTKLAMDFVKVSKEFSKKGLDYDVLNLLREASALVPNNENIRAKMEEMDAKCRLTMSEDDKNIDSLLSPVKPVKVPTPPSQTSFDEDKFVKILNSGDIKELCCYKSIGKAIAATIIEARASKTYASLADLKGVGKINDKWIDNFLVNNAK